MRVRDVRALVLAMGLLAFPALVSAQGTGRVQGVVTEAGTMRPLAGAQVFVVGTEIGTITNQQGRYLLTSVPAGAQTVEVNLLGYGSVSNGVSVTADAVTSVNFELSTEAVALNEIVVSGVSGATVKAKVPFEVATLNAEDLPVPSVSAASSIQGKVAGATVMSGSGRPGSAPEILLRGPKSISASGRDQSPLYIVDGVILGSSMVDIDAMDIENIEVLKGAAASSLYGSRAANGVVQITTRRGSRVPDGEIRYSIRSEMGTSELPGRFDLTQAHGFAMTPDGSQFLDANGNACDWLDCQSVALAGQRADGGSANEWNTFQINEWPGQTYDHVERFFENGLFMQNHLSADGRAGRLNFHVSFSNVNDEGVMPGQEGFQRNNFRINVDQAVHEAVHLSGSAFYSRSEQNNFPEGQGNPIFLLTRMPAGVDLTARDENGELVLNPDPFNENANPLYTMLERDYIQKRGRFLGSANLRVAPLSWLDFDANISYDRLDRDDQDVYPKGYRTIRPNSGLNDGALYEYNSLTEALNGSLTATSRVNITDAILNTTQLRYLYERQDFRSSNTDGSVFAVRDIYTFDNIQSDRISAGSGSSRVLAEGYYLISDFDIMDRYILSALVRNDGSSLFGPDSRRAWYYRFAGAWRMGMEEWFPLSADEFKLRYAYGTAGNRPNFSAQYETYNVSSGSVTPVTLGNRNLKPEYSEEHEAGIDAFFLGGRLGLGVTYARAKTSDQILPVPLPSYRGFGTQYQNAGTLESNTWELSLDGTLIDRGDFSWSSRVLFDRTRQEITELNVPPFTYGVGGQGLGSVFYARPGEPLGTFYGVQFASSCDHLPEGVSCDGFGVNDDGLLVWQGDGQSWGDVAPVTIRGATIRYGEPFAGECVDRVTGERTQFCQVGNSMPDYNMSLSNTLTWKGLSVYGLLDASQGFSVYNQPLQWATFQSFSGIMDQRAVAEAEQKPVGYFSRLYGVSGLLPSSYFVEDGSFIKLREVSLRYRFDQSLLGGIPGLNNFDAISLFAVGRNLKTWSDYRGYDPEVGRGGGSTGSAAIARVDGYNYPNFRTYTLGLELNF